MRIERIRLVRLVRTLEPPFRAAWDPVPRARIEATLVVVETDEGVRGVGSGDVMDGFERYEHLFVGEDPLAIERHVRVLETLAFHAGRYWPLEAALWDLAGKASGRPAAELLGASPGTRLRAYASTGETRTAEERAESALALRDEGFRALKLRIDREHVDEGLRAVAAVREAVGDTMEIAVDLNEGWRMPGDIAPPLAPERLRSVCDALRDVGVLWLEEPLPGHDIRGLAVLRRETGLPLAGGEMARTAHELDAYLDADALDILQPDAVLAVGLTRGLEVGRRAQARGRAFTPHTWTNGIGLLANLHLAAAAGAGPYLEFPYDPPGWTPERRDFMLVDPIETDADGCIAVPRAPGLGIELDEDALLRYAA